MIKKIRSEDLEVGMFVTDFNTPWVNHPFLTNQKKLRSARDIQVILDHKIEELYIDTRLGRDSAKAVPREEADGAVRDRMTRETAGSGEVVSVDVEGASEVPFDEELRKARELYQQAQGVVHGLFRDARLGKTVDGDQARETVEGMVGSMFRNRDALLSMARLKHHDDYTFQHSLNVAVLAIGLGSHMGILQNELVRLGVGALLHDLGKVRVPEAIITKPGPLTAAEFELVKTHSAHGAKLILHSPSVPDECAAVALNHHERYDGSGYPRGLSGPRVGKLGLIAAVVDVYDAMTSDRVYKKALPAHTALQKAYEWAGSLFHPIYVQKFIQCVGIYPVGSVVQLDTGERGVVCRQNRDALLRPAVRLFRGAGGEPLHDAPQVDLREPDPRGEKPFARSVEGVLSAEGDAVPVEALLTRQRPAEPARVRVVLA